MRRSEPLANRGKPPRNEGPGQTQLEAQIGQAGWAGRWEKRRGVKGRASAPKLQPEKRQLEEEEPQLR